MVYFIKEDWLERFWMARRQVWFVKAYRIVDKDGKDKVQPWFRSKAELKAFVFAQKYDVVDVTVLIYDNGGKTFDRYTAVFLKRPEKDHLYEAYAMSEDPYHPQGFGQHCTAQRGRHLGKRIQFNQLPVACQRALLNA